MIKHVGLVVAEVADGVLSEMRIVEGQYFQVRKPIQIEDFLEGANSVSAYVQVSQFSELVQTCLDRINLISCDPQLFQVRKILQVLNALNFIIANPQSFQTSQIAEPFNGLYRVVGQVKGFQACAFFKSFNFLDLILVQPKTLQLDGVLQTIDVRNTAVNQSQGFDSFKAIDDRHVTEIFKNEFNKLNFVDFFPLRVLEAVHFFLSYRLKSYDKVEKLTVRFFMYSFHVISGTEFKMLYFKLSMQKCLIDID